jgi:hypothetical protein
LQQSGFAVICGGAQVNTRQHCVAQHNTTQHSTTQHNTAQHSTTQHNTAQHSTTQHSTAQHSTAQHSTTQHNTALHPSAQLRRGFTRQDAHPKTLRKNSIASQFRDSILWKEGAMSEKITVAQFITKKIAESGKPQKQIAEELGYEHPNVISMIKTGTTKLPVEKVGLMARALNVDPAKLLRLVLDEYNPGLYSVIEDCLANPLLSRSECKFIASVRKMAGSSEFGVLRVEDGRQIIGVIAV